MVGYATEHRILAGESTNSPNRNSIIVPCGPASEFISEVIPVKYAKASEIVDALNKSAPPEWRARHRDVTQNIVVSGQDKLIADERTNSLLVYATREEMKQIKEIISHLDIVSAQILLEAVIIEVIHDNNSKFSAIDNDKIQWTTNFISNVVTNAPPPTTPVPSTKSAQVAGFYRFAAISNDLDSLVTTLASNRSVTILQRPRIQTSDKEPAQLFVGESSPYPSGSYTCGSSMQTVNLGVTLELTPSITNNHLIALDIHQTIEEANGSIFIDNVGDVPITRRSERSAKITVRDRDLVVLDGFIERENTPPRPSKLKRVLTLNGLFHHSKSVTNQNEFVVLIRPTILPPPEVAAIISKAEKDKMPGVKRFEAEIQSEEANRIKRLEENLKNDREFR
jgi:general secretion pathway protein D